jgi:outer membrane protein OmpA-like peptidoglycan-associated protein
MALSAIAAAQPRQAALRAVDTTTTRNPDRGVIILASDTVVGSVKLVGRDDTNGGSIWHDNTPRVTADGRTMFFNSTRNGDRPWAKQHANGTFDSDIYYATKLNVRKEEPERWSDPINLGPSINTSEDDAVDAISPSGGAIYFTSLRAGWVRGGGPFYMAELNGTEWRNIHGLGGGITKFFKESNLFKIYGASVGPYGDVFYFATTAHSATGDHEIWVSRLRDGVWEYPHNLGRVVNAGGGSYAPYIAVDGKTLYFTSGRAGGYGGDDVYVTVLDDTTWQEPVNLGTTINTPGEDSFFAIPASGDRVYMSTMKNGVVTISSAPLAEQFRPASIVLLTGTVTDRLTLEPVNAFVTIEDLQTNTIVQRSVGSGINNQFATILLPGRDYGISVSAPGYGFYSTRYTIPVNSTYHEVRQDIQLDRLELGKSFALNNIFFDYNSDSLRSESSLELDRLVGLMNEYPRLRITVAGHTDNIGTPSYNEALSRRRAEAVRAYLLGRKIEPSRIEAIGYGSSMPVAPNDTEEGRQKNRTVQFTILTM